MIFFSFFKKGVDRKTGRKERSRERESEGNRFIFTAVIPGNGLTCSFVFLLSVFSILFLIMNMDDLKVFFTKRSHLLNSYRRVLTFRFHFSLNLHSSHQ